MCRPSHRSSAALWCLAALQRWATRLLRSAMGHFSCCPCLDFRILRLYGSIETKKGTMTHISGYGREPQHALGETPEAIYTERTAYYARRGEYFERRWSLVANLRLLLFVAAAVVLGLGVWRDSSLLFIIAGLLMLGFLAVIAYHTRLGEIRANYNMLRTINEEGLFRLRRDWMKLPLRESPPPENGGYAHDLDIFGHASLMHLLGTANTPVGQTTLQRWLLHPAQPNVLLRRQGAVAELARNVGFRDDLALTGRGIGASQASYEKFLQWAEADIWLRPRRWLVWASRILPLLLLAGIVVQLVGLTPYPWWLFVVLVNYGLTATAGKQVNLLIDQVADRSGIFQLYAKLFGLIAAEPTSASLLKEWQADLSAGGTHAPDEMRRLGRIMDFADFRAWLLFILVQLFSLWTFHVLWALEGWQQRAGRHARTWLMTLGEVEALTALATLAHDNPQWTYPDLVEDGPALLIARNIAHPLLAPQVAVGNDVDVGPPGTFLLVTGSNMSGKSTLLRSIGLNVVLAQAGGPVCATRLQVSPVTLATSMRVEDSLERGVSYFMAELQRLKEVVDQARTTRAEGHRTLLYLLDEILHGTNTIERQIAARHIIHYLLDEGAIGAISTHDLALAETPDLTAMSRPVHFVESFTRGPDGPAMHFDYHLRPGIATSSNALKLMELVGLPIPEAPALSVLDAS